MKSRNDFPKWNYDLIYIFHLRVLLMTHENVKRSCFSRIKVDERNPLSQHQVKGDVTGIRRKYLKPSVSSDYQIPAHEETQKYFLLIVRDRNNKTHTELKRFFSQNCFFWELNLHWLDMTLILWNSGFHLRKNYLENPQGILQFKIS